MESPIKHYDEKELVVEKNALTHSRQTFSVLQNRILMLAASKIKQGDKGDQTYEVNVQDLVEFSNTKDIYNRLEKETRELAGKDVTLKVKHGKYESFEHWSVITRAKQVKGSGILEIEFHSDIRDMLFFDLGEGEWNASVAVELASCTTKYAPLLYRKFMSHRRRGKWEVSVKDLRFELGLENKYKSFYDFRERILKKAQEDLQKHTNMRFTWEEEKNARGRGKGRKITDIIFDFSWKPDQMNLPIEEPKKDGKFDIFDLRKRLKKYAELSVAEVDDIMKQVKQKTPAERKTFAEKFYKKFQVPIDTKTPVAGGKVIQKPYGYCMKNYERWMRK